MGRSYEAIAIVVLHANRLGIGEHAGDYTAAAIIVTSFDYENESEVRHMLEESYRRTNNIDSGWHEDPEVYPMPYAKDGARSTSVGDVVLVIGLSNTGFPVEAKAYRVAGLGFEELGPARSQWVRPLQDVRDALRFVMSGPHRTV